jgi:D-alanine-D-alanine ligase
MEVPWKTEYDVVATLQEMGHAVLKVGVAEDLSVVRRAREEWKPDIVFNMMEAFHELGTFDHNVVSYLELLRVPYTGCNPRGLMLARDKALSKTILHYHRIAVPEFAVVHRHCPGVGRLGRGEAGRTRQVHPREHRD